MGFVEDLFNAYADGVRDPASIDIKGYVGTSSGILIPEEPAQNVSMNFYELHGSPIKDTVDRWRDETMKNMLDRMQKATVITEHGPDIIYTKLTPKVKWFKPPLTLRIWKFEFNMTWAYKVEKAYLLKDCQLVPSVKSDEDIGSKSITLEWNATKMDDPRVDAAAENLGKAFFRNKEQLDTDEPERRDQ